MGLSVESVPVSGVPLIVADVPSLERVQQIVAREMVKPAMRWDGSLIRVWIARDGRHGDLVEQWEYDDGARGWVAEVWHGLDVRGDDVHR